MNCPGSNRGAHIDADVIVIGAGLADLAAAEAAQAGRKVLLLDQEGEQSLGGQAWWSFGGLFFVDSPEQRRLRIKDSLELAWQDWTGTADFDRPEDELPRQWARAYVEFAATEKRSWLRQMSDQVIPVVGWAEPGGYLATGHGNSVPRWHRARGWSSRSRGGSEPRPTPGETDVARMTAAAGHLAETAVGAPSPVP